MIADPRLRCALAIGLLVLPLILGAAATGSLLLATFSREVAIERLEEATLLLERRHETSRQLLDDRHKLERLLEESLVFLAASSVEIAGPELAGTLTSLVEKVGGTLTRVEILEPVFMPLASMLGVRMSGELTIEALRDFLLAVEAHRPALVVGQLRLSQLDESVSDQLIHMTVVIFGRLRVGV